ncbi:MAG: XdhC family protein [Gammaproteobacteria bacterium]|nr:XdhC family protein [Gammaproteobacteria bacterium]
MPAIYLRNVLPTLQRWHQAGLKTALVTLFNTDGSTPRPLGSQMAIAENGDAVGNITGGCAEAAIIAEAQACMAAGQNRSLRYGAGSPYIDIRLPCGSGIDVYFDVNFSTTDLARLLAAEQSRRPAWLALDPNNHRIEVGIDTATPPSAPGLYLRAYPPITRLVLAGKGPALPILARLASAADFEVIALSPEPETLEATQAHAARTSPLTTPDAFHFNEFDRFTAFVSLFHEHEWEPPILRLALASDCFYVGALGSKRTHQERVEALRKLGVKESNIARIRAPVGLKLGGKNPPEIALAILAEIVKTQYAIADGA